jgi:hypothetical protein
MAADNTETVSWATFIPPAVTFLAVVVALFMKELRAWWRPPKLRLTLLNEHGEAVTTTLSTFSNNEEVSRRSEQSRWFHLKVSNPRRKADAVNGVTVRMLRLAVKGADGRYHPKWRGSVPVVWQFEGDSDTSRPRVVGTDSIADLCSVVKDKWLDFHLRFSPNDFPTHFKADEAPVDVRVTVQACGDEVDSDEITFHVFWDGKWESGELEMRKHFYVKVVEGE